MKLENTMAAALVGVALCLPRAARAEPITVRHAEGLVHGFLSLSSPEGKLLASGDLIQRVSGDRVTSRLVFRFKDGSVHDETAVFRQRGQFLLLSDHLVQKGPAFERAIDMTIDRQAGQVTVRYSDDHGEQKSEVEKMELPPDLANGMIITLLKNINPKAMPKTLSYVAATPKPRLVKFELSVGGTEQFTVGRLEAPRDALRAEGGDRRRRRRDRAAHRQAARGLAHLDHGGRSTRLRTVAGVDGHGRPAVADRPGQPGMEMRRGRVGQVGQVWSSRLLAMTRVDRRSFLKSVPLLAAAPSTSLRAGRCLRNRQARPSTPLRAGR